MNLSPNPKHLKLLQQGVKVWNSWRKENVSVSPELQGADLYRANLVGADLSRAVLEGANLRQAELKNADMWGANLERANLFEARLQRANLEHASLYNADLYGAKMQEAQLSYANLDKADLKCASIKGACLKGARIERRTLINLDVQKVDLSDAKFIDARRPVICILVHGTWAPRARWTRDGSYPSAGAIIAALFALGCSVKDMELIMKELDFTRLMDGSKIKALDYVRVLRRFGIYKGNYFHSWLKGLVAQKFGKAF